MYVALVAEPELTAGLSAAGRLPRGRQGQEPNPGQSLALAARQDRAAPPRAARRGAGRRHRGTDDAAGRLTGRELLIYIRPKLGLAPGTDAYQARKAGSPKMSDCESCRDLQGSS